MLTTARLRLRPFVPADLAALLSYRRDPEVARYQSWSSEFSDDQGRAFIDSVAETPLGTLGAWVNIAVAMKEGAEIVGDVGLRVCATGAEGEIGFTFSRAHRKRGYAREAVGAVCDFAFSQVRLPLLYAVTDARNAQAIRLLEHLGFRHAGFHARGVTFKGELCDELRFERAA